MVKPDYILSKLPAYYNVSKVLVKEQSVKDIKKAILERFENDKKQYDAIAVDFVGRNVNDTCKRVFDFLRKNVDNVTEGVELQSVKSPAAIIATGKTIGSDCKNYSLFVAGVLSAIDRLGYQKIPLSFRFARYRQMDGSLLDHVFVVVYPGRNNEIWVDCIKDVPYFDCQSRLPDYYTDKKIKSMALVSISGLSSHASADKIVNGLIAEREKRILSGRIKMGDVQDRKYLKALGAMGVIDYNATVNAPAPPSVNPQINSSTIPKNDFFNNFMNMSQSGNGFNVSNLLGGSGASGLNVDFGDALKLGINAFIPGGGAVVDLVRGLFGRTPDDADNASAATNGLSINDTLKYYWQLAMQQGRIDPILWFTYDVRDKGKRGDIVNVDYYLATMYNQWVKDKFFPNGNERVGPWGNTLDSILINTNGLSKSEDIRRQIYAANGIAAANGISVQNQNSGNDAPKEDKKEKSGTNPLLLVGGGLVLAKLFKLI